MQDQDLVHGLPAGDVLSRARLARRQLGKASRALLFWLAEVDMRKLFQEYGFSTTFAFAENELELDAHTVAEMLRTAHCLQELPLLLEAADRIAPSKLREISRVCSVETQEFWIETARSQPYRTIEKLVAITPKGGLPQLDGVENQREAHYRKDFPELWGDGGGQPGAGDGSGGGAGDGDPARDAAAGNDDSERPLPLMMIGGSSSAEFLPLKLHHKFIVELEADELAILEAALKLAAKACGRRGRAAGLLHLAESYLNRQPAQAGAGGRPGGVVGGGDPSRDAASAPQDTADLTSESSDGQTPEFCQAPEHDQVLELARTPAPPLRLIIHSSPAQGLAWMEAHTGMRRIAPARLEEALCCGEILDLRNQEFAASPDSEDRRESDEEQGNARVAGGRAGSKQRKAGSKGPRLKAAIPPSVRRMVAARDGGRCMVPGCCNGAYQHMHHITARSEGGSNRPENLVMVCFSCHVLLHEGKLDVQGQAPDGLVWRNAKGRVLPGSASA